MPELPEVETTLRGIMPHIAQQSITHVIVRHHQLRWPIPKNINAILTGQTVHQLTRRAKYLLFQCDNGYLLLHLGMSGRIRILPVDTAAEKHDHVDILFGNDCLLRFTDPRRFGAALWIEGDPEKHPLLSHLGPEPLTNAFNNTYLYERSRARKAPVKSFIMDNRIVVGVGNIYAAEALFAAGIHPNRAAGKISAEQYEKLVAAIKKILRHAIKKGGTTLKDFTRSDGSPSYFSIELQVYGKQNQPCPRCKTKLKLLRIGQRSTVYCPMCQK